MGAVTIRLRPHAPKAVAVVLYLYADQLGTVALDDTACVPAELGEDPVADTKAVDHFISVAVEGRATAFHFGRGRMHRGPLRRQDFPELAQRLAVAWLEGTHRAGRVRAVLLNSRTLLPRCARQGASTS
jgi:hypothetical protein